MTLALILSSYVAASRVGGMAQALALSALEIEPVLAPTTLFGRHPGRGAPGGGSVSDEMFDSLLGGLEADGVFARANAVITGYFASAEQVRSAARTLDAVRAARPGAWFVVDPIMGDAGRLYVSPDVADAITLDLIPRADLVAPNAWELERLSGLPITDPESAVLAARTLNKLVLVSSVPCGDEIGVAFVGSTDAWLAVHRRETKAPNGVGDLLTALFTAGLLEGLPRDQALAHAVGGVAEAVSAAQESDVDELPIVAIGARLGRGSPTVRIERLA